jgi:AbrB family looped-hinge helix DNA binding protein
MSSTIILGKSRRLVLPKPICDRLHLREGDAMEIEMEGDSIRIRPSPDEGVKLVQKRGLLVATGFPQGVDIGAAVLSEREARETSLAQPFQPTRPPRSK